MSATHMPATRLWAAYLGEIRIEFIKAQRTPAFAVPTLFFPIMFYMLFGVVLGSMRGNESMSQYAFATYGVFGAMGPGLFGFGVSLALDREYGLLKLQQAMPQPAGAYLLARAVMAMLFVAIISVLLTLAAVLVAHVPLTVGQGVQLFLINVLGALPFCAIGLFVGSMVSGPASPAIVNVIFLPMAFLSGLWWPLQFMPQFLQDIAPAWPAYHLAQMALETVGAESRGSMSGHIAVLLAVTMIFFLLAVRRMQGGGFRLMGKNPVRNLAIATGAAVAILALSFTGVFGDKTAAPGGDAAAAASEGAGTTETAPAGTPAGVPAPATALLSSFDEGSASTAYGSGWVAVGDTDRGGDSTASQRVIDGGAAGSQGALEVSGTIGGKLPYPFAGAMFFPEGQPMQGIMDFSAKKTLRFQARGDGRRYTLLVISGDNPAAIPLMVPFEAGAEWQEVKLDLKTGGAADFRRVRAIGVGAMGPVGEFRFQIDDVRFE